MLCIGTKIIVVVNNLKHQHRAIKQRIPMQAVKSATNYVAVHRLKYGYGAVPTQYYYLKLGTYLVTAIGDQK